MTLAAIILAIGVPNFSSFLRNSRLTSTSNDVIAAMHAARSEAIKRQVRTVFCFSADPVSAPACDGDGTKGWIVFVDSDNDAAVDAGEQILVKHAGLPDGVQFLNSKPAGNKGYVSFQSSGFSAKVVAVGNPIESFLLCDSRGNTVNGGTDVSAARGLEISLMGRASVTRSVSLINTLGNCT
jgi:type IV fimbrial biogenesis protein FimT